MLILELMTSLLLWITIMIPINSYLLGVNERSPYKIIQDVSNQTIFDATKVGVEVFMNRSNLCAGFLDADSNYEFLPQNIPVKSTSTEATAMISDGKHLFVSLDSASTTDFDLMIYDYKNITEPVDKIDSGPGIIGVTFVGRNLFAINSSVNSAIQRFKFDEISKKLIKVGDYKIPWSSSYNPIYASKITSIYPHIFVGLKKNTNEELLSIDLNKIDSGLASAIDKKWELDSSVSAIWPMFDKYLHLFVSMAKEPEINDFCLNCDFLYSTSTSTSSPTNLFENQAPFSTFDLFGSLGNVRSLITEGRSIYVGRSSGNNELFKIDMIRDYSSTTTLNNSYDLINSIDVNGGVYSMLLFGKNLVLVEGKTNSNIQIRDTEVLSKIIQTISTNITISDLECVGGNIFGVGSNYTIDGTTTISITPIIFQLNPVY
jgi:hypothetical protein